ncbi:MAG: aspartate--tRNA ligase [Nanoarchaeota archaeon]|nr:aspartate--tRNA ligase [Nanoarchaeota archaeon]
MRTHTCGELTKTHIGKTVQLCGWIRAIRTHGGVKFIDLRDRYGITQIVFNSSNKDMYDKISKLGKESVIQAKGNAQKRKAGPNPALATGDIEVIVEKFKVLSKAESLPMEIDDEITSTDETRLKYRYLDLRRPCMLNNFVMRHNVITAAREFFNNHKFLEIETPMLVKSTPEGARDYVVPSRVNPGKFYALPQSPQLYKQLLMIAGFDRYYQLARCMRDEDLRQDRQPEHTQLDFEMSFVNQDAILAFVQGLYKHIFKKVLGMNMDDFPAFTYKEAMNKFGTDKPDLRFGLEISDVTFAAKKSEFGVFKNAECVKCLNPAKEFSRKEFDKYTEFCKKVGAHGLVYGKVTDKGIDSSISKFLSVDIQNEIIGFANAKNGTSLLFIADTEIKANKVLGQLRLKLADDLKLRDDSYKFCFVNDFPLFSWNEDEKKWEPEHHMFSMPKEEFVKDFENRPEEVVGDLWDVVLNGLELGSGSIRVSDPKIQERIMNFVGIDHKEAMEKFGFLLQAYKYGGPVHGGMGLGVDRLVALMVGQTDIREVIVFPKNKNAECPMDGSPSEINKEQMKELGLKPA